MPIDRQRAYSTMRRAFRVHGADKHGAGSVAVAEALIQGAVDVLEEMMSLHRIRLTSKACPDCGKHGGLTLANVLVARGIGDFSLAGAQDKVSAVQKVELACSLCGKVRIGRLEGVELSGDDGDGMTTFTGGHFVQEEV